MRLRRGSVLAAVATAAPVAQRATADLARMSTELSGLVSTFRV